MAPPTARSKAIDAAPLLAAIRTALLANATVSGGVTAIRPDDAEPQDKAPYIVLSLIVATRDGDTPYDEAGVDATIQATLITEGTATALRTQLIPAMLTAVLDNDLVAVGYTIWDVALTDQRNYSDMQDTVVRRYGALRFRVRATMP